MAREGPGRGCEGFLYGGEGEGQGGEGVLVGREHYDVVKNLERVRRLGTMRLWSLGYIQRAG